MEKPLMGYRIFQFNLGKDRAQAYVLSGTGKHEGTNETVSFHDVMAAATDSKALAAYLDRRFLRAHGERIAHDLGIVRDPTVPEGAAKIVHPDGRIEHLLFP